MQTTLDLNVAFSLVTITTRVSRRKQVGHQSWPGNYWIRHLTSGFTLYNSSIAFESALKDKCRNNTLLLLVLTLGVSSTWPVVRRELVGIAFTCLFITEILGLGWTLKKIAAS